MTAWCALGGFEERSSFLTWMTRIALRTAGRVAERRRRRTDVECAAADAGGDARRVAPSPEEQAEDAELGRALERSIDALPESYRLVFALRVVEGLSTAEVARDLGISEANVKVRLLRARERLRVEVLARAEDAAPWSRAWRFAGERCNRVVGAVLARIGALSSAL